MKKITLLALSLLALLFGAAEEPNRPTKFAIQNATIVAVASAPIEEGTLLIDDGLITGVGRDITVPADAWIIDGKGLTVYPGLIDAMTSIGLPAPPSRPSRAPAQAQPSATPATSPLDRPATTPWKVAGDSLKADDKRIEQWRNAGFTSVVSVPTGGIFPGQASVLNLAGERANRMVIEPRAALVVAIPSGRGFSGFPGSLMGRIAYIKQVFLDAGHYREAWTIYRTDPKGMKRPAYDRALEPIREALEERRAVLYPANEAKQIHRALDIARELKLNLVIYGAQQSYETAAALARGKTPVLVNLEWPTKPKEIDPESEETLNTLRLRDRAPGSPAALEKAGVPFAFYSGNLKTPKEVMAAVKKAIDRELSPAAAIRALTLSAARIYGAEDRLGSLEAGKIANVLVTDGELFAEKTRPVMVFIDGRKFDIPKQPATKKETSS